ncbi:porin family protein [Flavihumibacter sp. R14]|nr:porin family protein [Flavihumibacter soli]
MNKLSEDPIDRFFKETLKSPDLKYNKKDWKGLEARLPRKSRKKVIAWLLPAAAALLIFVSLWLTDGSKTENQPLSKTGVDSSIKSGQKTRADEEKKYTASENSGMKSSLPSVANTSSGLEPLKTLSAPKQISNKLYSFTPGQTVSSGSSGNNLFLQAKPVIPTDRFNAEGDKFNAPEIAEINVLAPAPENASIADNSEKTSGENINSRLSLALSFSPDINSVSNFSDSDIGSSIGVGASYKITPRLSVEAAIGYSKKVYSALPYQYKASWSNSNAAKYVESIDADCRVLDVPVNLRYTFASSSKQSFFVAGGLSSYFMLEETYTLIAKPQSGYPNYTNPSYSYKNENNHLLSVTNFSVGINKPLNKQTSIVIQPYIKLPLTGIGQGKVDLQSTGVIFQLEYNLPKKKKISPSDAAQ